MKKTIVTRCLLVILSVGILINSNLNNVVFQTENRVSADGDTDQCQTFEFGVEFEYPLILQSREKRLSWIEHHESLPEAHIDQYVRYRAQLDYGAGEGSFSLLDHLEYAPIERDQGNCGDCWQWAGTGILEIAQDVQIGIKDRLSIQYMNSCGGCGCNGGNLPDVVAFYNSTGKAIPWSNTNAHWQDGDGSCDTSCGTIATTPYYPITSITEETISTHGLMESEAISNIKNALNQGQAVQLGFLLPTTSDWNSFRNFWNNDDEEDDIWSPDYSSGHSWVEGQGGGHAVLVVGYNDGLGDANDYWVILNSWGTTPNRPNGLFRLDMHLDYDCFYYDPNPQGYWSLYWDTLDLTFPSTPDVSFSSPTYGIGEDSGSATITASLSEAAPYPVTVKYSTSDGTATEGIDYGTSSGTLTFTAGNTSETFSVPVTDDSTVEPDETVILTLSNAINASLGNPISATLTITSEDVPDVVFSSATYSVAENVVSGTASITVELSQAPLSPVTVNYTTDDGTALAGADYATASGTLNFTAGDTSETFSVPITDDSTGEGFEIVNLTLSNPSGATLGAQNTAALTIQDDDTPDIAFSSDTYAVAENVASGTATITVELSHAAGNTVTVNYTTSNGTALAASDYTTTSGTLTFTAGVTSQTFDVPINDDAIAEEANETVILTLSNPVNANQGSPNPATLTIQDNDAPNVVFLSASYTVAEGSPTANIEAVLSGTSTATITVNYATNDGTATGGIDYGTSSGTLTFTAGGTSETFSVSINDDAFVELDETVNLALSNPVNAVLGGTSTATLTISSEDVSSVFLATDSYGVSEDAGTVNIGVMISPPSHPETITVNYATSDGTALAGADYTSTSGTLTFSPDDFLESFSVITNDDGIAEGNETISITLSNANNANLVSPGTATLTIIDDDAPDITFSPSGYTVAENVASGSATVAVILSGTSTQTIMVHYATSDGTALAGVDYTSTSGTLSFAAGDISKTFSVPIDNDGIAEGSETIDLQLSNPANANLGTPSAVALTIYDDDAPNVAFSSTSYTVAEGSPTANIEAVLSGTSTQTIMVHYATSDGTALAGSDYTTTSGTLTFAAGDTSETFAIPIIDDSTLETDETVTLTLSNPANANLGTPNPATLTITSDDVPEVTFSSATYSIAENVASGTASITVELSQEPLSPVTVNYTTSDGTALAGSDYTTTSGTLTFSAGDTSETFSVPITDDSIVEADETITIILSNAANADLGTPGTAIITILDNDAPDVAFSSAIYNVAEGTPTATIETILSGTSAATITVNYATSDSTGVAGADYTTTSGTLTFTAGDTSETFTIPIIDDIIVEPDETVSLTLSNPANANLGTPSLATLIITSGDVPDVAFSSATYSVIENVASGTASITVELSQAPLFPITVNYTTGDGIALAGADYTTTSGTLSFTAGDTSETFYVPITDDSAVEADETITLTLINPSGTTLGIQNTAVLTITNDDIVAPTVTTNAASNPGETSATMNGTLDNLGGSTNVTVLFEWGRNGSYVNTTAAVILDNPNNFTANLSGLQAGTTYQFRAKATNDGGSSYGNKYLFTTNTASSGGGSGGGGGAAVGGGGGGGGGLAVPMAIPSTSIPKPSPVSTPKPAPVYTPPASPPPPPIIEEPEEVPNGFVTQYLTDIISPDGKVTETVTIRSSENGTTLIIPAHTEALDAEGQPLEQITVQPADSSVPEPPDSNVIYTLDFGPDDSTFDPPITITMTYDPDELPEGVAPGDLALAYYDNKLGEWIELFDILIDTVSYTISGKTSHFTRFAVLAPMQEDPSVESPLEDEDNDEIHAGVIAGPIVGLTITGLAIFFLLKRQRRLS